MIFERFGTLLQTEKKGGTGLQEVKTIIKRLAFYYLLLAINIIPNASILPDRFPTRNVSSIYLLTLAVVLVLYYAHRVPRAGGLSAMMRALSWMAVLLILLRGVKYSAFAQVGVLARHTWYLYYVPMLLFPLFLFYISLFVSGREDMHLPKGWYCAPAVTVILLILVLSNDLHQLVFRFAPGFANWDNHYSYGTLFYIITGWQYFLYLAAVVILVVKCRIGSAKKSAWIIGVPLALGIGMNVLLMTGKMPRIHGDNLFEFPEVLIFTAAAVLECCMQLGLIPTNTHYGKLFRQISIAAQITDAEGTPVYSSNAARELSAEQFSLESGARIGTHTLLHKLELPGGFGFWQEDVTALDRLKAQLAEAKEELAQEAELMRLRGKLKEEQVQIEQRTRVYNMIAQRTQKQSQAISRLAQTARETDDLVCKEACRKRITLLGAYIKRYANLTLLSQDNNTIEVGELGLSVSEALHYLNIFGVPGEFFGDAGGTVCAEAALKVFEVFALLLDTNLNSLHGVIVNLTCGEPVTLKLTLENVSEPLEQNAVEMLRACAVNCEYMQEDEVIYYCFTLPKGGETV